MSRSDDERSRASRAEARRRARLAARGELPEAEPELAPTATEERQPNLLRRIFPAAPPLPGRPDPLAGFDPSGSLRPVRERLFLLRQNVPAWLLPGIAAFVGYFLTLSAGVFGLLGTFVLFGSLIAAGWFGWQRPTLYGTTAALISFVLTTAVVLYTFASEGAGPETFESTSVILSLGLQAIYQAGLGFIGGWYGGYLRRRQTQLSAEMPRRRR
ncbi:MAG TPA: hypothetical protein VHQ42_01320 [Candidatus Limnocylindria bacterium]|nr:hypothetical protein [Candidatus Limnocylindria bacterium]